MADSPTDWADLLAAKIIADVKADITDADIVAMLLRTARTEGECDGFKMAGELMRKAFTEHGIGGGDK